MRDISLSATCSYPVLETKGNPRKSIQFIVFLFAVLIVAPVKGEGDKWSKLMATGYSQTESGQSVEAERTYRDALIIAEKSDGKYLRLPVTLIKLASVCEAQAKHDEAYSLANRALTILNQATNSYTTLKLTNPSQDEYFKIEITITVLGDAAFIYSAQKKYNEAEPLLKSVVTIREGFVQKNPPKAKTDLAGVFKEIIRRPADKLIKVYENLAIFYFQQGKNAEAESIYKQAFKFFAENSEGAGQTTEASIHNKLGELYFMQGKYAEAETSFLKALGIYQSGGYKHGIEIGLALKNLATLYLKQEKNYNQARSYFHQALKILEEDGATDQSEIAEALENYAIVLRKLGEEDKAVEMANRAKVIRDEYKQPVQNR